MTHPEKREPAIALRGRIWVEIDGQSAINDAGADLLEQMIASGSQKAKDILDFDVEGFFRRIGLDQFISSQRRNGLAGMVGRIRGEARGMLDRCSKCNG